MRTKLISAFKYLLFLGAGIVLLWLAFRNFDLQQIYARIKEAHFKWVAISMFVSFFAFVSRAHRWNMLIKPLGYKPSLKNSTCALMVGYFANLAIPRIGEVSRCAMLGKAENIPLDKLLGTVIAERVVDVLCLFSLMILLAILQFQKIGDFLWIKFGEPTVSKMENHVGLLFAALLFFIFCGVLAWYFLSRKEKQNEVTSPLLLKLTGLFKNIAIGLKTVMQLENNVSFFMHTVFIWTIYFFVAYICFFATDATSQLGFMEGLFSLVIGGVGMSMPVQGGIGTYHWLVSEGLTLYGVPLQEGLVFATIVHASQTLFIIVSGALSYFILILSKNKSNEALNKE